MSPFLIFTLSLMACYLIGVVIYLVIASRKNNEKTLENDEGEPTTLIDPNLDKQYQEFLKSKAENGEVSSAVTLVK